MKLFISLNLIESYNSMAEHSMLSPLVTTYSMVALILSSLCHSRYSHPFLSFCSNPDRLIQPDSLTSRTQEGLGQNHIVCPYFLFALGFGFVLEFGFTQSNKTGFCFVVDCVNGFVFVVGFLIGMRCTIALQLYWVT